MAKRSRVELVGQAICDLGALGYRVERPPRHKKYGKNVRILSANGESEVALIQTRSQSEGSRYLFGIMLPDLPRVDSVVLWFEACRPLGKATVY